MLTTVERFTDAAHTHSPTGGQGMNTGFVDAVSNRFYILKKPFI